MRRLLHLIPALTVMSCATIVSGPLEKITVNSTPPDARAVLRCPAESHEGVTPLTVSIRRNSGDCNLTVSKEGFAEQTFTLERGVNPAHWFNFITAPLVLFSVLSLSGGFYGDATASDKRVGAAGLVITAAAWLIDHHTGAAHRHEPAKLDVTLKPSP